MALRMVDWWSNPSAENEMWTKMMIIWTTTFIRHVSLVKVTRIRKWTETAAAAPQRVTRNRVIVLESQQSSLSSKLPSFTTTPQMIKWSSARSLKCYFSVIINFVQRRDHIHFSVAAVVTHCQLCVEPPSSLQSRIIKNGTDTWRTRFSGGSSVILLLN